MEQINRYKYITPARSFCIYYGGMIEASENGLSGISSIWEMECDKDLITLESEVTRQYEQWKRDHRVL